MNGTIKRFLTARGYGFIQPDAGGEAVFFHQKVFEARGGPPPITGERVTYSVPSLVQGVKAESVERAEPARHLSGVVTNYNPVKGFGFVRVEGLGSAASYYLHKSELLSRTDPVRGSRVDFYASPFPVQGESPRACFVTVIS